VGAGFWDLGAGMVAILVLWWSRGSVDNFSLKPRLGDGLSESSYVRFLLEKFFPKAEINL
jgi:hypothetical protein